MALDEATRGRIESLIDSNRVVLFMKGTRGQPQCGFSAATVSILDSLMPDYETVNVLEDPAIREGVKQFSDWPTIPQLYIDREFMGGCDVVKQMFNTGELHEMLGMEPPDRTPPQVTIADAAARMMRNAVEGQPGMFVHLSVDSRWQHNFTLGPAEGHEIRTESNGVEVLMDVGTARKVEGLIVDMTETLQGSAFTIDNPNAPPPVNQLSASELKHRLDAKESLHLFDVRAPDEREKARIEGSQLFDEDAVKRIESLPKDTTLVFYCHFGPRSQSAAEYFRVQGYTDVHNLVGGIEAWSQEIDPGVPRY